MPEEPDAGPPNATDATRRTWLAAERTWLAWWRTGVGAAALAIAVGRLVPAVTHGARWPFIAVGIGYAVLAVAILVIGALRQLRTSAALRRGEYSELSSSLVLWLTAAAVVLSLGALALVAARI